jgi:hypothetical protein
MMRATTTGVRDTHVVVPSEGPDRRPARLCFDNGLERFEIGPDAGLASLLDARFAEPPPIVWAAQHDVHVSYPLGSRLRRQPQFSTIHLHPATPWSIEVHGGAADVQADLRGLEVLAVTFHDAIANSTLRLGPPRDQCVIRVGAVKDLRVTRPGRVPVRVQALKGVTDLRLDDQRTGAARGVAFETEGYATARNRYLLIASAGVSTLTIDPDPSPDRAGSQG